MTPVFKIDFKQLPYGISIYSESGCPNSYNINVFSLILLIRLITFIYKRLIFPNNPPIKLGPNPVIVSCLRNEMNMITEKRPTFYIIVT